MAFNEESAHLQAGPGQEEGASENGARLRTTPAKYVSGKKDEVNGKYVDPNGIPDELKAWSQWVGWCFVWREDTKREDGGSWTKVLKNPRTGGNGSPTNPKTWGSFDEALQAMKRFGFDGIGFVLTKDDPFVVIDLDDCLTGDPGYVLNIMEMFNSYTEVSPSGNGVHIFLKGKLPEWTRNFNKKNKVEVYDKKRFVTVTGWMRSVL